MTILVPTEEREALRSFFDERWSPEQLQAATDSAHGHDAQLWKVMAEDLGLSGLAVPEDLGGGGFTYADLLVVFEEMGTAPACSRSIRPRRACGSSRR